MGCLKAEIIEFKSMNSGMAILYRLQSDFFHFSDTIISEAYTEMHQFCNSVCHCVYSTQRNF